MKVYFQVMICLMWIPHVLSPSLLKQSVCNALLWLLTENVWLQAYSFLLIWSLKELLFFVSITTHNHTSSEPIFTMVSPTIYLSIFLLVEDSSFFGKYFWIQFRIETWFLLIKQRMMALQKFFLITNLKNKNIKKITNIF